MLSQSQFNRHAAQGHNRIPLVREVLVDLETPLSTYLKLAAAPYSYLLESVQGGEKWGRYSIIGLPCKRRLEVRGMTLRVIDCLRDDDPPARPQDGKPGHPSGDLNDPNSDAAKYTPRERIVRETVCDDPLDEIRRYQGQFRVPQLPGLPRFGGGLVGFFGYDTVRYIEPHLASNQTPEPVGAPDILLLHSDEVAVFDNLSGRLHIIVHADAEETHAYEKCVARLDELQCKLASKLPRPPQTEANENARGESAEPAFTSSFPRMQFEAAVEKCREYIYEGDIFQAVISQRMALSYSAAPLDLYRALRTLNPSPYMYYLHLREFHIAGASPEILVRLEDGEVTLRPIAGTRPRGATPAKDEALAEELLADPKECAEHLMLMDLGRNDVGRVAKVGSVKVTEMMAIEKYSHVMHIVSNVCGRLREGLDAIDVLRAAFPAGTLSGAPKVRALEIIEALEPEKRGVYSGAVGYIGWGGNMDTAIAIRTALIKDSTVYVQAGGGIVADSVPANEWEETMNKGRAVLRAVAMASAGLHRPLGGDSDDEAEE